MPDPIRPQALLEQARVLAGFGAGRGRPRTINHRRAVSAAYYGLYHSIIGHVVQHVLPDPFADDDDRLLATRFINHADVNVVAKWVGGCAAPSGPVSGRPGGLPDNGVWQLFSTPASRGTRQAAVPSHLRTVVDAFPVLMDARHAADYDHLATFPKATAQGFVEEAEAACAALDQNSDEPYVRRFSALVAFKARRT